MTAIPIWLEPRVLSGASASTSAPRLAQPPPRATATLALPPAQLFVGPCTPQPSAAAHGGSHLLGWNQGIEKQYRLGGVLGRGANAVVRAAVDISQGTAVAIKILPKTSEVASRTGRRSRVFVPRVLAQARDEGRAWQIAQAGPGADSIVRLLETYEDADFVYFVSELCAGGSLEKLLETKVLGEDEIARTFLDIVTAIHNCHSQGIFYGDTKPANFLVSQASPELSLKMADFGCACLAPEGTSLSDRRVGTPLYKSPESFVTNYDKKADLWGAGVVLYQMCTGHHPLWTNWGEVAQCRERMIGEHICQRPVIFDDAEWQSKSSTLRDLAHCLLRKNPKERLSASETLQHPFFAGLPVPA